MMLSKYQADIKAFDVFLKEYINSELWSDQGLKSYKGMDQLHKSMEYSLFSGGKRFRPLLALLVADLFSQDHKQYFAFAAAVEMVHTYSLIHDDLPCMDDDDERRGQPTNHKVFGETVALLAGDCLLTEAFALLTQSYKHKPEVCVELCSILAKGVGFCGMIGGQVLDIEALKTKQIDSKMLTDIHKLKTAALIALSIEGAAVISGCTKEERSALKAYGLLIGEAFQVADDILDYQPDSPEASSYVSLHGLDKSKEYLSQLTEKCGVEADFLKSTEFLELAKYNNQRTC